MKIGKLTKYMCISVLATNMAYAASWPSFDPNDPQVWAELSGNLNEVVSLSSSVLDSVNNSVSTIQTSLDTTNTDVTNVKSDVETNTVNISHMMKGGTVSLPDSNVENQPLPI